MTVYVLRAGETQFVKIGTANHVASRVATLQMGHYDELLLIREIEGGRLVEAWMHREFRHLHHRGEWFRFDPAMLTVIPPALVDSKGRRGRASVEEFLSELSEYEAERRRQQRQRRAAA